MRTLAVGDIHGCLGARDALPDPVPPAPVDRRIALGACVDRGFRAYEVLERLIRLYEAGRLIPLRGNHDEMMVTARFDPGERRMWLRFGGCETLDSYGHWPTDDVYDRVPERHWRFLAEDLRNYYETETHLFTHACARPDLPLAEQDNYVLLWQRLEGPDRKG